jgi:hypothetical protein
MKTNRLFTVLRLLALGVLVGSFNAKAASAPAFQGKFTLLAAVRWGQATLPAGNYSLTLDHAYPGGVVTVLRGTKIVARVQSVGTSFTKSGRSEIIMAGGAVSEIRLPTIGVTFDFPSHNPHHMTAPEESELAQIIPVTTASGGR